MNRVFNFAFRQLFLKLINKGNSTGIDHAGKTNWPFPQSEDPVWVDARGNTIGSRRRKVRRQSQQRAREKAANDRILARSMDRGAKS